MLYIEQGAAIHLYPDNIRISWREFSMTKHYSNYTLKINQLFLRQIGFENNILHFTIQFRYTEANTQGL